jgi:hypothetical protein
VLWFSSKSEDCWADSRRCQVFCSVSGPADLASRALIFLLVSQQALDFMVVPSCATGFTCFHLPLEQKAPVCSYFSCAPAKLFLIVPMSVLGYTDRFSPPPDLVLPGQGFGAHAAVLISLVFPCRGPCLGFTPAPVFLLARTCPLLAVFLWRCRRFPVLASVLCSWDSVLAAS